MMRLSETIRGIFVTGCILGATGLVGADTAERPSGAPEMILYNGTVLTMDRSRPTGQAVAITGDRIVGVGTDAEMRALAAKSTRMVDLQGKTVLPGFIDSKVLGPFGYWEALHGARLTDNAGTPMSGADEI